MAILHKRKTTGSYAWQTADLAEGQLGVNLVDGTLHIRDSVGAIQTVQNKVDTDAAYATSAQGTLSDSATQPADNISTLTNDSAFITGYTVTQGDVTGHQAALSITESQISDLGSYATAAHVHEGTAIDATAITDGYVLTADGAGNAAWEVASGGISDIVGDLSPQLGGSLDVNGQTIVSVSAGNITITPDTTGSIVLDGLNWPQADGTANQVLETDGAGQLSWVTGGGGGDVVTDLTPQLGGFLDTNGQKIYDVTGPLLIGDGTKQNHTLGVDVSSSGYMAANTIASGNRSYGTAIKQKIQYNETAGSNNRHRGFNNTQFIDLNGNNQDQGSIYKAPTGIVNLMEVENTGVAGSTVTRAQGIISVVETYNDIAITDAVCFAADTWQTGTSTATNAIAFEANLGSSGATNNWALKSSHATAKIEILGKITTGAITFPNVDGAAGQMINTDGAGNLAWTTPSGGLTDIVQDTTPQLGGDLDLNSNDITGVGSVGSKQAFNAATVTGETNYNNAGTILRIDRDDASDFDSTAPNWSLKYKGAKATNNWDQSYQWYVEQLMRGWNGATFYTHTVKTFLVDPGSFDTGSNKFNNGSVQFGVPLNAQKSLASSSFGGNGTVAWNGFINDTGVPHSQFYASYSGTGTQDIASTAHWDALYDPTAEYNSSKGFWEMTIYLKADVASVNIIRALSPNDTLAVIGTEPTWVDSVNDEFDLVNGDTHQVTYRGIAGNFSVEYKDWTH